MCICKDRFQAPLPSPSSEAAPFLQVAKSRWRSSSLCKGVHLGFSVASYFPRSQSKGMSREQHCMVVEMCLLSESFTFPGGGETL